MTRRKDTHGTHSLARADETEQPSGLRLYVVNGPDSRKSISVVSNKALIGTAPECDLILGDRTVSRQHAVVENEGGVLTVRDLSSRNGTTYHGAKITSLKVPWGAHLLVGQTQVAVLPTQGVKLKELSSRSELAGLVGDSLAMRQLFAEIERLAPTELPVLITGETGSGKEGVARALHALSARAEHRFCAFDCGAVPRELMASTLFGHAEGAFTGAVSANAGALELAGDGTLFLDELGELPLEIQPVLTRVLATRAFSRVGEHAERPFRARVVTATHRNLLKEVKARRFREGLYHRVAVATLEVPPLRERIEDLRTLIHHFAQKSGTTLRLPPTAMTMLAAYQWPGNVRELENVVQRIVTLGAELFLEELLPKHAAGRRDNFKAAREKALEIFEKTFLESVLETHQGSVAAAAKASGVTRAYLYKLMKARGMSVRRGQ